MFRYLPEQASEYASNVDWIHNLITDLSVLCTIAVVGAMLYFAIKYRRRDGVDHETPQIKGSHTLEIVWTVFPTIVCIIVAYYGVVFYQDMRANPKDALTINVWGQKWKWDFEYENGKAISDQLPELVVPVNKPVKLVMQSRDVLHSFFIPAMRAKRDLVPGMYSYLSFKPIKVGTFPVFCAEYCGRDHSQMMASIKVVSEAEFERWLNDDSEKLKKSRMSPAKRGQGLYSELGCAACHSLDGSRVVGPSFLKIFGREGKLTDGSSYVVDENYIKESILNPAAKIVEGYPNLMVSFDGRVTDDDIHALIAFMKSLDKAPVAAAAPAVSDADWAKLTPVEKGKKLYEGKATPACKTCHSLDGSRVIGPSFKGVFGRDGKLADGSAYVADEAYIRQSILDSMSQVVEGYAPAMPPYKGILSDDDVTSLIEFLKTVK